MRLILQFCLATTLCGAVVAAPTTQLSQDDVAANMAMGHRFSQLAQISLAGRAIVPQTLRQSIVLLKIANRLDPVNPAYLRLLIEANLELGGQEGRAAAIESLNKYLQLEPTDIAAKARLIDLHFSQIDTADQRLKYIEQIITTQGLTPELRSRAAVLGAQLARERAEDLRAREFVEQALKLFPLSPEALELKFEQLDPDAPVTERIALMIQMLRSNPAQAQIMRALGDAAASVGLVDPAVFWYGASTSVDQRMGMRPSDSTLTALACELVIADQIRATGPLLGQLIERDPGNVNAAFLNLLVQKRLGDPQKITSASESVTTALMTRLGALSDLLNAREPAAPAIPGGSVDIAADLKKLDESQNADLTAAYAANLTDLAWLHIYFLSKPDDAQTHVAALRQLLAADSVTLARLDGWTFLVTDRKDEARVKLSAVADNDPLSALGMLRLDADQTPPDKLTAAAKKLVIENALGLTGALLMEAVRDRIGLAPLAPNAQEVRAELDKFPKDWLDIMDMSRARNFYTLKAEPVKVSHAFGEPIFARVIITNVGPYPITVGSAGTLHPDLWVDVQITGVGQRVIPGVAFDRIGQSLLLRPRDSITQTIRVDQGGLVPALQANPVMALPLNFSLVSNPMMQPAGVVPGPSGYRVQFARVVQRAPTRMDANTMQSMFEQIQDGRGDARLRVVELLAAFAMGMKTFEAEEARTRAAEFTDVIRKSTGDRAPSVRAHAMFLTGMLAGLDTRVLIFKQMLTDPAFQVRAEGIAAIASLNDPELCQTQCKPLADSDPDPLIRELATAAIEVARLPVPTTQPEGEVVPGERPTSAPAILPTPGPIEPSSPGLPSDSPFRPRL